MPPPAPPRGERYLLIKGWGFGFWADMAHVTGSLLLAEITGRIPLVYWGPESLFGDSRSTTPSPSTFEPVSSLSLEQLVRHAECQLLPAALALPAI
jgi:hypothetical protein